MIGKIILFSLALTLLLFSSLAVTTNAQYGFYGQPAAIPTPTPMPPTAKSSFTGGQLRACQARESAVKNRMESLVNLVTNMEEKFSTIAKRVEDYYTNKILPSGKTVSNYSSLVADIDTKKGTVQKDLATVQGVVSSFSCSSGDPKGLLTQFRTGMQTVKKDLQDYRTSIKNLIVAVRSVSSTPETSPSPEGGK